MQQVDRTKICWDCEADVNDQATYCPFCGTDLLNGPAHVSSPLFPQKKDPKFADQTLEQSLASLYNPPYSARNRQGLGVPDEREQSSYLEKERKKGVEASQETLDSFEEEKPSEKGTVLSLLFLMIGAHFLVLGMLLFFCAKEGMVTLQWSNRFWFLYLLIGSPLLYFGMKRLKNQQF